MTLIPFLPSAVYGADRDFVFNNTEALSGWRFENVKEARFSQGGLLLKGNNYLTIGRGSAFAAPAGGVAMKVRFKAGTPENLVFHILLKTDKGWESAKTKRVNAGAAPDEESVIRLYLGKAPASRSSGPNHYNFGISFSGADKIVVRLDSLRFYKPSFLGLFALYWEEFWTPDVIVGTTVGYVATPSAGGLGFISMLYIFTGLAFIPALFLSRHGGRRLSLPAAGKTLVIIFLCAWVVFAVRMDFNWLNIWRDDLENLSGADVETKVRLVNYHAYDSILDFVDFIKKTVPAGRAVRPAATAHDAPLAVISRYYMLPVEDSAQADFLWSYGQNLRLDSKSGALYAADGKVLAPRVRLFAGFAGKAAIYEVIR